MMHWTDCGTLVLYGLYSIECFLRKRCSKPANYEPQGTLFEKDPQEKILMYV